VIEVLFKFAVLSI